MKKYINISINLIFIFYLIILFDLVFFRYRFHFTGISGNIPLSYYLEHSANFIPFKTINNYLSNIGNINNIIIITNILGNILAFIPFGFFIPLVFKFNKLVLVIFHSFMLSLFIEVMQMIFRVGSFDVDDIILNMIGGLIGFILFELSRELILTILKNDLGEK